MLARRVLFQKKGKSSFLPVATEDHSKNSTRAQRVEGATRRVYRLNQKREKQNDNGAGQTQRRGRDGGRRRRESSEQRQQLEGRQRRCAVQGRRPDCQLYAPFTPFFADRVALLNNNMKKKKIAVLVLLLKEVQPGKKIYDLCELGDKLLNETVSPNVLSLLVNNC